tara:strand:- start:689 stop:1261 length:573 start_codon:yes stop_codon:yes gene_type:complete
MDYSKKEFNDLKRHAWIDNDLEKKWIVAALISFLFTLSGFIYLANENGLHDHFMSWGYKDEQGFIKIYDEEIKSQYMYSFAIIFGIVVAISDKIIVKPGERVIHSLRTKGQITAFDNFVFITVYIFYEAATVLLGIATTFLFFTNLAILMAVLLGRIVGSSFVFYYIYPQKNSRKDNSAHNIAYSKHLKF